jgi:hypothetical protein
VVEQSPHRPKVEGSSPVANTGTGRENGVKMLSVNNLLPYSLPVQFAATELEPST